MMMIYKTPKELELIEKVTPVVNSLQFDLRDVDVLPGSPAVIRVTIDIKDRSRGVNLDDCYAVHRVLDPLFDVWDPLQRSYTLEVSSPGEKASLRLKEHFEEALGDEIEFRTREGIKMENNPTAAPRKKWKGKLVGVQTKEAATQVVVEDDMGTHAIDASLIEDARWLRNWTANNAQAQTKENS